MNPEWNIYSTEGNGLYHPIHPHQQVQTPASNAEYLDPTLYYLPTTTSSAPASDSYFPTEDYNSPSHPKELLSPGYSLYLSSQQPSYSQHSTSTSNYPSSRHSHPRSPSYNAIESTSASPYPPLGSHSPGHAYEPSPYTPTPYDSPSPLSFSDGAQKVNPELVNCFFPPFSTSSSPSSASSAATFPCDFPSCTRAYPRLCDLRKHKKRHQKPFPCPVAICNAFFSSEKDRDRHERSKHRREEHLVCPVCGHRTARKDNMKDHVRRRHGEEELDRIMGVVMAGYGGE